MYRRLFTTRRFFETDGHGSRLLFYLGHSLLRLLEKPRRQLAIQPSDGEQKAGWTLAVKRHSRVCNGAGKLQINIFEKSACWHRFVDLGQHYRGSMRDRACSSEPLNSYGSSRNRAGSLAEKRQMHHHNTGIFLVKDSSHSGIHKGGVFHGMSAYPAGPQMEESRDQPSFWSCNVCSYVLQRPCHSGEAGSQISHNFNLCRRTLTDSPRRPPEERGRCWKVSPARRVLENSGRHLTVPSPKNVSLRLASTQKLPCTLSSSQECLILAVSGFASRSDLRVEPRSAGALGRG